MSKPSYVARAGAGIAIIFAGAAGVAAVATDDRGVVVVASRGVVADPSSRKVQLPAGGVLREISARNGDHVKAGDVIARLDDTVIRTGLVLTAQRLDEMAVRKARLEAERDDAAEINLPEHLASRAKEPEIARIIANERKTFELRRTVRIEERKQLNERIGRLGKEIGGYNIQVEAKGNEISIIERELKGARELRDKNLMPITKLTQLERDAVRLQAEQNGQLPVSIAQAEGRIAEIRFQLMRNERDRANDLNWEIREAEARLAELTERKVTVDDQLRRTDVHAPLDGVVQDADTRTVGRVIGGDEAIMRIVSLQEKPMIEARIAPRDIRKVQIGQSAELQLASADDRQPPRITGRLNLIASAATTDSESGQRYYKARVAVPPEEVARLGQAKLTPGTQVEVLVQTQGGTRLSDYVQPLADIARPIGERISRAF